MDSGGDRSSPKTTVCEEEIDRFSSLADQWWDPDGKMGVLHKFNPVRLEYIRDRSCMNFGGCPDERFPLRGLRLLDIGCGAGLLCEPLARLGAEVTGIDPSEKNIQVARAHASSDLGIDYQCCTVEELSTTGKRFDIVLCMEVVEHVADVSLFLQSCADRVAPGGILFLATINRTFKSFALAIVGAEYILGWLPQGCHDWNKFLTPDEMEEYMTACRFRSQGWVGVVYNPFLGKWHISEDLGVNYMFTALKEADVCS